MIDLVESFRQVKVDGVCIFAVLKNLEDNIEMM